MKKLLLNLFLIAGSCAVFGQDAMDYQVPPKAMADLLLAKPTPSVSIDSKAEWMLFSERNSYPSVEELAMPEYRIAGMRINPNNYSASRQTFINNFSLKNIKTDKTIAISGLPNPLFAGSVSWNPSETKISFTQTDKDKVDLYVIDVIAGKAMKVNKEPLNAIMGTGVIWADDNTLLYRTITKAASMAPAKPLMPKGPTIQQNLGKAAPSATLQDLIKSPFDEQLFEFFATSQLVENIGGVERPIGTPAIYSSVSLSPDNNYMMLRTIKKPFSYLVSAGGFPSSLNITDRSGKVVKNLVELPSTEVRPSGYDNVQNVPRGYDWRDDEAATVVWAQPLDSGLIKKEVPFHDAVYSLSAPFTSAPKELFKTSMRFSGISWGNASLALVREISRTKQTSKLSQLNPSTGKLEMLYELNTTDAYNNPGIPVTTKNKFGKNVILTTDNGSKLLLNNTTGASAKGDLPFLAKFDLKTKKSDIIWRSQEGSFEMVTDVLDPQKLVLLTRKESQKDAPNYFIKNLKFQS